MTMGTMKKTTTTTYHPTKTLTIMTTMGSLNTRIRQLIRLTIQVLATKPNGACPVSVVPAKGRNLGGRRIHATTGRRFPGERLRSARDPRSFEGYVTGMCYSWQLALLLCYHLSHQSYSGTVVLQLAAGTVVMLSPFTPELFRYSCYALTPHARLIQVQLLCSHPPQQSYSGTVVMLSPLTPELFRYSCYALTSHGRVIQVQLLCSHLSRQSNSGTVVMLSPLTPE